MFRNFLTNYAECPAGQVNKTFTLGLLTTAVQLSNVGVKHSSSTINFQHEHVF